MPWLNCLRRPVGAYAGPIAEHCDGFSCWDSKVNPWNSVKMGAKRDIVGEMAKAIRNHHMKFVTTFHHSYERGWFPTWDKSVDASNPKFAAPYGPPAGKNDHKNQIMAGPEFSRIWEDKVLEVIDKYHPDLVYFDSLVSIVPESYRKDLVAHYYNESNKWKRTW